MELLKLVFAAALGSFLTLLGQWVNRRQSKKDLERIIRAEIQKNVDLLVEAEDSPKSWPKHLFQDVYKNYLDKIHLLPKDWLSAIWDHYEDVRSFEQLKRDVIKGHQNGTHLLPDRAKKALESGKKALEIMNSN